MRILDHQEQGTPIRRFPEQVERRQGDEERVWGSGIGGAKGCLERAALRARQPVEVAQERVQQLMKAGERKIRLGLDAGRAQDPDAHTGRRGARRVEERGLAHPRVSANEQRSATVRGAADQAAESLQLGLPAE